MITYTIYESHTRSTNGLGAEARGAFLCIPWNHASLTRSDGLADFPDNDQEGIHSFSFWKEEEVGGKKKAWDEFDVIYALLPRAVEEARSPGSLLILIFGTMPC